MSQLIVSYLISSSSSSSSHQSSVRGSIGVVLIGVTQRGRRMRWRRTACHYCSSARRLSSAHLSISPRPTACIHADLLLLHLSLLAYIAIQVSLSLSPADMITMVYLIDFEKSSYLLYYIWSTACVYLFFLISLINYGLWWKRCHIFCGLPFIYSIFFKKKMRLSNNLRMLQWHFLRSKLHYGTWTCQVGITWTCQVGAI